LNIIIKVILALAILLVIVLASIDLKDTDNEAKSDRLIKNADIEKEPGFEAVFVIIILLATKYIITRYKDYKEKKR